MSYYMDIINISFRVGNEPREPSFMFSCSLIGVEVALKVHNINPFTAH
jgi:hypothetical protein